MFSATKAAAHLAPPRARAAAPPAPPPAGPGSAAPAAAATAAGPAAPRPACCGGGEGEAGRRAGGWEDWRQAAARLLWPSVHCMPPARMIKQHALANQLPPAPTALQCPTPAAHLSVVAPVGTAPAAEAGRPCRAALSAADSSAGASSPAAAAWPACAAASISGCCSWAAADRAAAEAPAERWRTPASAGRGCAAGSGRLIVESAAAGGSGGRRRAGSGRLSVGSAGSPPSAPAVSVRAGTTAGVCARAEAAAAAAAADCGSGWPSSCARTRRTTEGICTQGDGSEGKGARQQKGKWDELLKHHVG